MSNASTASSPNNAMTHLATVAHGDTSGDGDDGSIDLPEHVADVWAAVLIDVHKKRKDKPNAAAAKNARQMTMQNCVRREVC